MREKKSGTEKMSPHGGVTGSGGVGTGQLGARSFSDTAWTGLAACSREVSALLGELKSSFPMLLAGFGKNPASYTPRH